MARLYVAPLPKVPVLTLLGSAETVVSTSVIRGQLDKMEAGELVLLENARHEILMEEPATLEKVWRHIDDFLARVPLRRGAEARLSR
jgi:lysophospholipase